MAIDRGGYLSGAMEASSGTSRYAAGAEDYPVEPDAFDEAFRGPAEPRPLYRELLEALARRDLDEVAKLAVDRLRGRGAGYGDDEAFTFDPVPRLFSAQEWERAERGLCQRVAALNALLADAYGEQQIFAEGVVPQRLIATSPSYEPAMRGLIGGSPAAVICGLDVVRGPDGDLMVLEDNLRMPSGMAYATAARDAVAELIDWPISPRPLETFEPQLAEALRGAAPDGSGDPSIAVLSQGPDSFAWYEQGRIADVLGAELVTADQLELAGGRLHVRLERDRKPVDVVYRRLEEERLTGADGEPNPLGELLLPPLRAGRLRCVNAFGTGLADDKLAHVYSEEMIRFYLGEEPILRSVPSFDPCEASGRAVIEERTRELVVKPRAGYGGEDVVLLDRASPGERDAALDTLERDRGSVAVQLLTPLSTHPTIRDGRLRPRHVDLRPFVVSGPSGIDAFPGGLTRFATGAGGMVVNSSQGGGGKDTWVVDG
jgi:carboxylate-amine ligase